MEQQLSKTVKVQDGLKALSRVWLIATLLLLGAAHPAVSFAQDQQAVDKAHRFLFTDARGKEMLSYLHMGATYRTFRYVSTVALEDNYFELVYRFYWTTTDNGYTVVGFTCDPNGNIKRLAVIDTDAIINQPFAWANASIQILGNMLLNQYQNQLSEDDKRLLRRIINDADAKSLLEWSLRFEQFTGN